MHSYLISLRGLMGKRPLYELLVDAIDVLEIREWLWDLLLKILNIIIANKENVRKKCKKIWLLLNIIN